MKTITKYKAFDGSEFNDESKCLEYENESNKALSVVTILPDKPNSCDFSNGHGYVQHDAQIFLAVRKKLLILAKHYTDHKWIQESIDGPSTHASWAHRIISECGNKSLNEAWYRILCTDKKYREWGQPFYVEHPDQAEQIKLN